MDLKTFERKATEKGLEILEVKLHNGHVTSSFCQTEGGRIINFDSFGNAWRYERRVTEYDIK